MHWLTFSDAILNHGFTLIGILSFIYLYSLSLSPALHCCCFDCSDLESHPRTGLGHSHIICLQNLLGLAQQVAVLTHWATILPEG